MKVRNRPFAVYLIHLVDKLLRYRAIELDDPQARTVPDWYTDEQGRRWARSTHERDGRDSGYPFPRAEVLYDPATFLPHAFTGYDWPDPDDGDIPPLGEQYIYEDVILNAPSTRTTSTHRTRNTPSRGSDRIRSAPPAKPDQGDRPNVSWSPRFKGPTW